MTKLLELKDPNGTSIQSFAELLAEKCKEHNGLTYVLLFVHKPSGSIHSISNVDMAALPRALKELAHSLRRPASGETEIKQEAEN